MDSVALWNESNSRDEDRVQRKIIRDQLNIMGLSDKSFVKNFRLSKDAFMYVLCSIDCELKAATRSTAIPTITKLSTTLKISGSRWIPVMGLTSQGLRASAWRRET